jgi:hypothetical protein
MNMFIHAASHYAIFARPIQPGKQGQALLASLILNTNDQDACADLLDLHRNRAIKLVRRGSLDDSLIARSLQVRGLYRDMLDQSLLCDGRHQYGALLVRALAATGDTIRDHGIRSMRGWITTRNDALAEQLRLTCAIALGEREGHISQQAARALCARQWNQYAGVLGTQN